MGGNNKKKNPFAQPSLWGASTWRMLHCVSMTYPKRPSQKTRDNMEVFLTSLGKILPCRLCACNYQKYVRHHPFNLSGRDGLMRWMIDLHNDVNMRLKKPILSYEEALDKIHQSCPSGI